MLNSFNKFPQRFWSNAKEEKNTLAVQRTYPKLTKIIERKTNSEDTFPLPKAALSQQLPPFSSVTARPQVRDSRAATA